MVLLGFVLLFGLVILLPHWLVFVLDVDQLYANLWGDRDDMPLVYRRLADVLWRSRRQNFSRVQITPLPDTVMVPETRDAGERKK